MKDNGANTLVVELAFDDEEFELPKSKNACFDCAARA